METPASILRKKGVPKNFSDVSIGQCFELNGNVWQKRTTRTAIGIWPAILPRWAYVGKNEKTYPET